MNTRTHLTLVPATGAGEPTYYRRRSRRPGAPPPGGRAAGIAALAAGLTLGLALGAAGTLGTHPGDYAVLLPVAGAAGITLAAALRSRAVAHRRRRAAQLRRERLDARRHAAMPKPVLVHSRDEFRRVLVATGSVATPTGRAA